MCYNFFKMSTAAGAPVTENSNVQPVVDNDSKKARDEDLPPSLQFGRIENVSIAPISKNKTADTGNATYAANQQIIFYLETGGAAFLNTKETYLTFLFTPTVVAAGADTKICRLDPNSSSLFQSFQLQINGNIVEDLKYLNLYNGLLNTLEEGQETLSNSALAGNAAQNLFPIKTVSADNVWFGASSFYPRVGAPMTHATGYQLAYHIQSYIIGCWAKKFFPLAFINQLMFQLQTDLVTSALRNTSYTDANFGVAALADNVAAITYAITNLKLHYTVTMVQDSLAAAVQKAYLSNSLPDLIHSSSTYMWQKSSTFTSQNMSIPFTLSATSVSELYFVILRDNDWTTQSAASCTNFVGGLSYVQLKVNGQPIPANRIDTTTGAYEMYRQLAFGYGKQRYKNNQIILPSIIPSTGVGVSAAAAFLNNPTQPETAGLIPTDQWNGPVLTYNDAANDNTAYRDREQGCTVLSFSLSDKAMLEGWNTKSPIAIRGQNIQLDLQFTAAITPSLNVTMFALIDTLLIMKGTSISVIS